MKKLKRLLSVLFSAALLPVSAFYTQVPVQAGTSALAQSYNSDPSYVAYASEVEDQSATSYCWAYMADAVLESYLLKNAGVSQIDFSESDMISQLNSGSYAFSDLYTGGNYHQAIAYWTRGSLYGPRLETNSGLTDYYVSETAELGRYDRANQQSKQNYIQNIKNLLVSYGAVGVSVYFDAQTRSYMTRDGAYYYPQELSPGVNHGVTIVGWNDNYPPQWFFNSVTTPSQPQNKGAFLVKNSWGKYDASSIGGNTGYYWISYDNYFQDAFAVTQVIERSKLYNRVYETDYRGLYDYVPGNSYSQMYNLTGGIQWLSGFSTYVKAGASYRFYLNNQELTQFGGTMAQSGYHTFQLSSPIEVYGTIQLRVEVTGTDEGVPLACSYYSHEPDGSNVCLKVFTKYSANGSSSIYPGNPGTSQPIVSPGTNAYEVTGITLSPQECTVAQGATQVFTARISGTGQLSQRVNWQISGKSSGSTRIADNGVLYVGANETSSVLYIYASPYDNPNYSASARVAVVRSNTSGNQTVTNPGGNASNQTSGNTGTNINGSPSGTNSNVTGNVVNGNSSSNGNSSGQPGEANINGSEGEDGEKEYVRVGAVDKGIYTFWEDGTAQYMKCTTPNRIRINIPANVKMGGQKYDVTVLDESCIRSNKKVQTVTIGKNISQIGEDAFYGCKKLKKIKIKSEQVEYIGENAFEGIAKNAVIYVPQSCLTEYRVMVRESGNTKARVRAYN